MKFRNLLILLLFLYAFAFFCLQACQPDSNSGVPSLSDKDTIDSISSPAQLFSQPTKDYVTELGAKNNNKYIQGEFSIPKAMAVVYGLYDNNLECSKWMCLPSDEKAFGEVAGPNGEVFTRAVKVLEFEVEGTKNKFLITESPRRSEGGWESCHGCGVVMGAALFAEIEGDWFVQAFNRNLGYYGAFGELPAPTLFAFEKDNYGIRLDNGFTSQGITENQMTLIGLPEGKFSVLLDTLAGFSNEGMFFPGFHEEKAYTWTSEIRTPTLPGQAFPQLQLIQSGKRPSNPLNEDSPIRAFRDTLRFELVGMQYKKM